jgi:hypothetical protein
MRIVGVPDEPLQVLEGAPVQEKLCPEEALLRVLVELAEHRPIASAVGTHCLKAKAC